MSAPTNRLKANLAIGQLQLGLWLSLCSPLAAEICAARGFDWLLVDGEHAPNDLGTILSQLQSIAARDVPTVVRVPIGEPWVIKRVLDLGAQSILVPMVETVEQARAMVAAVRYPPRGIRGVGASYARASDFGAIRDYSTTADDQICLIVQVESRRAIANAGAIAALDGIDGVFIGPADLSADMGHLGNPAAPEVQTAIAETLAAIRAAGTAAGIIAPDPADARRYIDLGANFVALGGDAGLLSAAAAAVRAAF